MVVKCSPSSLTARPMREVPAYFPLVIFCAVKQVNAVILYDGRRIKYILCFPAEFLFLNRAEKTGYCIGNQTGIGLAAFFKSDRASRNILLSLVSPPFYRENRSQRAVFPDYDIPQER